MAGFLDKNTRVVDMVLTGEGKYLLSKGELRFTYWVPFDDEVDYSPFITNSGSLTGLQLSASIDQQIENSPIREATTGYRTLNVSGSDETNVRRPMFTLPQGYHVIPRMTASDGPTGSLEVVVNQRKVSRVLTRVGPDGRTLEQLGPYDMGFERFDSEVFRLQYGYGREGFPPDHALDGFLVRVLRSGTDGLTETHGRVDVSNAPSYGNDLRVTVGVGDD